MPQGAPVPSASLVCALAEPDKPPGDGRANSPANVFSEQIQRVLEKETPEQKAENARRREERERHQRELNADMRALKERQRRTHGGGQGPARKRMSEPFVMIGKSVLRALAAKAIRHSDFCVLAVIADAVDHRYRDAWIGQDEIGRRANLKPRAVQASIARLVDARLLAIHHKYNKRGFRTSSLYRILQPGS